MVLISNFLCKKSLKLYEFKAFWKIYFRNYKTSFQNLEISKLTVKYIIFSGSFNQRFMLIGG